LALETRYVVHVLVVPQFERPFEVRVFEHAATARFHQERDGGAVFARAVQKQRVPQWQQVRKPKRRTGA
jgi:hypothetical protein